MSTQVILLELLFSFIEEVGIVDDFITDCVTEVNIGKHTLQPYHTIKQIIFWGCEA